jgi:hypothetical protein
MEDGERVLVAFLVATAAQQQGQAVVVCARVGSVAPCNPSERQGRAASNQAFPRGVLLL